MPGREILCVSRTWSIGCLATLLGCAAGVSTDEDGAEREVGRESQALAVNSYNADFWPNGRVPVCLHPRTPETVNTPEYAFQSARIKQLVEAEFETIPDAVVDVYGWQICDNLNIGSKPGWVRVIVAPTSTGAPFTRYCGPGTTISTVGDCDNPSTRAFEAVIFMRGASYPSQPDVGFDTGVLHEFGHVIAKAPHEQDRADKSARCIYNGSDSGDGSQTKYLTVYDPYSIMLGTYCSWSSAISQLDRLGIEILYNPGDLELPVRARHGFQYGSGTVSRADDTVVTDWTFRGADDAVLKSVAWQRQGSSSTVAGTDYPASALPARVVTQVGATFTDFRGRSQSASGNVLVDDSYHAAIVVAALIK